MDKKEDDEMREESKNYILKEFMAEETGVGVIELVLILVRILTPYH